MIRKIQHSLKVLVLAFGLLLGTSGMVFSNPADAPRGFHDGVLIHKSGVEYEVVMLPREIRVYANKGATKLPNELIVKVKNENGILDRFHLTLIPNKSHDSPAYSSPVPANIYFSAGLTFDIDF
jgi:hypothetical protein